MWCRLSWRTVNWLEVLSGAVAGNVETDVLLAEKSTFRIGGPADAVLNPATPADVAAAVLVARDEGVRWMVLGLGSNVLFADKGFRGLLIKPGREMAQLEQSPERPANWYVGAGLPLPILARRTARAGWGGVHSLIGVPGALGGGVAMNAGAHGQDLASVARSVDLVTVEGDIVSREGSEIDWQYRNGNLGAAIVVGATLELVEADPAVLDGDIRANLEWRKEETPFDRPCCGSVFKNPKNPPRDKMGEMTAGRLIEATGMKGMMVGGARVSDKHANYIVNVDNARAQDVLELIDLAKEQVYKKFEVELELEVKVIQESEDR